MKRTIRLILVAALAIMQGIFGILRAFEFFRMGIYLSMRGILLLPVLGAVAFTWPKPNTSATSRQLAVTS
jgi:hypothetical protein